MRALEESAEAAEFGVWLARQLKSQGISQSELAARIRVTRAAVSAWVTGRAVPRMDKITQIEAALGLVPGAAVAREETPDTTGGLVWYHRPAHPDGGRELGNPAGFAFDAGLSVLAREATQNSLDERHEPTRPVRVRYTLHEISGERLENFLRVLRWDELEPHLRAAAERRRKVGRVIDNGLTRLRRTERLLLLRVDDYNAKGLTGSDYDDGRFAAVVRRQLDSFKGETAGGSFGLGKATLWAASSLGLVLINSTLSEPHEGRTDRRLIGRLDLPWRSVDGAGYAGPSWLGRADPERGGAARSWWADRRTTETLLLDRESDDPGTSFLVVGVHDVAGEEAGLEEMHASLVKGIAENFWAAMLPRPGESPLLEASVTALRDGAVVVAEKRVEPDAVDEATRTRVRALRAHYEGTTVTSLASTTDVVRTSVPLRLVPSRNGVDHPASSVIEHEAVMLVATTGDEDDAPNRLVAMRGNRMVVLTRRLTDVPIGMRVQGVLLAGTAAIPHGEDDPVAEAAEAFLRACEPPEHDDWTRTDDVVATYERGAATRIREFRAAMMSAVGEVLKRPLPADDKGPSALRDLLTIDLPSKKRTTGRPTVRHVSGEVNGDGAWTVRVEMELPRRADPWVIAPTLRFATRSGPKPTVGWARLIAESGCTVTHDGLLRVDAGVPIATFSGVSDVDGHPVQADDSVLEVDLTGAKEVAG